MNLIESNKNPNFRIALIASQNKGTIENFVINLEETMYAKSESGVVCNKNTGIIKNGYVYGKNVNSDFVRNDGSSVNIGIITRTNSGNGQIKNIYSLVNVDVSNQENIVNNVGNIVSINNSNALVENVYSVGLGKNITNRSAGPNIYYADGKISNNYYFNDEIFTNKYHKKTTMLELHDTKFQNQLLNNDNRFNVDEYVSKGYYPQLIMPSVMPNNEYIELPEVKDADLADILSTEVVKKGIDTVEVKRKIPNTVQLNVTERKAKYQLEFGNAFAYLDGNGNILEISSENNQMPIIRGYETLQENIKSGNKIVDNDCNKLLTVQEFLKVAEDNGIQNLITIIDISNDEDYKFELPSKGKVAYMGDGKNIGGKILTLKEILTREEGKNGQIFINDSNKMPYFRENV